jgi:hypothetical protein
VTVVVCVKVLARSAAHKKVVYKVYRYSDISTHPLSTVSELATSLILIASCTSMYVGSTVNEKIFGVPFPESNTL